METKDLTGHRFGRWVVIGKDLGSKKYHKWLCRCDCGKENKVIAYNLISGGSKSCGCLTREKTAIRSRLFRIDLTGKKFGRLTVIKYDNNSPFGKTKWLCQCICGNKHTAYASNLVRGKTKSCGCLSRELSSKANSGKNSHWWKGGVSSENIKFRASIEYRLWREAIFARDGWICVHCGQRGGKLNADHIKPFSQFPELRLALDNGRTLCEKCHRKTPTFGSKSIIKHENQSTIRMV